MIRTIYYTVRKFLHQGSHADSHLTGGRLYMQEGVSGCRGMRKFRIVLHSNF